jgi:threonine dehydratase
MSPLFAKIMQAHVGIRPQVQMTPLERSAALSTALGCNVLLKNEHLQLTGSFKFRGATNKIRILGERARETGVLTASTGNHGLAMARAGALAGVPVTVFLPSSSSRVKTDAIRALGAQLVSVNGPPIAAELMARRLATEQGKIYVPPYNDYDVVAGQGTLGVELSEQACDLDAVFIAVGGGGLIGGTGTALRALSPRTRVVGVWPEHSPCMLRALEAGRIIDVEEQETLSDGTAGAIEEGSLTFGLCQEVVDETVTVSETEIASAMRIVAATEHWMVEGAAGVALAGLLKRARDFEGMNVAVVLCGRNISIETFLRVVA